MKIGWTKFEGGFWWNLGELCSFCSASCNINREFGWTLAINNNEWLSGLIINYDKYYWLMTVTKSEKLCLKCDRLNWHNIRNSCKMYMSSQCSGQIIYVFNLLKVEQLQSESISLQDVYNCSSHVWQIRDKMGGGFMMLTSYRQTFALGSAMIHKPANWSHFLNIGRCRSQMWRRVLTTGSPLKITRALIL